MIRGRELLVSAEDGRSLPKEKPDLPCLTVRTIGRLRQLDVVAGMVPKDTVAPEGWCWADLRRLYGVVDDARLSVAGRAALLLDSESEQAFCGRCGATTTPCEATGRTCPNCHLTVFSRIEPAVIVAVRRAPNLILLARGSRLPSGIFSVLAGFVEPGESLEQCAIREVHEETGIRIKALRYMGSQSWPFPRSLMVGFLAEYESGDIVIDPGELERAEWFSLDALPPLPSTISISRWLVDCAIAEWKAEEPK
jgi:NAD+ diphosphatase